jgi:hypothetical protein
MAQSGQQTDVVYGLYMYIVYICVCLCMHSVTKIIHIVFVCVHSVIKMTLEEEPLLCRK